MINYQHEKLAAAVSILGSLTLETVERIESAMQEFDIAFRQKTPPSGAEDHIQKIRAIMEGAGKYRERAAALNERQLHDLSQAFFGLYEVVSKAYWQTFSQ